MSVQPLSMNTGRARRPLLYVGTLVLVALAAPFAIAHYSAAGAAAPVWNTSASAALAADYHKLHDAWNMLDVPALKRMLAGDDQLATFDLDPETYQPIKLQSKADMDRFTDRIFQTLKASGATVQNDHPRIACRATDAVGVCTEECRVNVTFPDGRREVQLLRATAVATRQADGWKFIQWHMSSGGPAEYYDSKGHRVASH